MVTIRPFKGLRYSMKELANIEDVVAPPYDVISPQEQQALYQKSPYNIVRLILGLKQPSDTDAENIYSRAHTFLETWKQQGVLQPEGTPALYAYSQTWDNIERRGFIATLQIEPYETGKVLPHEFTLGGPKADRLALMKATGNILSPIFCLYHDPQKWMESLLFASPIPTNAIEIEDQDQVLHRFWPVTDPHIFESLQTLLKEKTALIADGHHRYETAMAYQAWRREQDHQESTPSGSFPWDFTMAFFTNMADSGLKIYPTHRVFTSLPSGWTAESLIQALSNYFEPTAPEKALFWVQHGLSEKQAYQLKSTVDLSAMPESLRTLDVALLDQFVFQTLLKQPANQLKQDGYLEFIRDEAAVRTLLQEGALAFWVHAPSVDAVRTICESGLRMPQKSTYFYPKLLSGLVLYDHSLQNASDEAFKQNQFSKSIG